MISILIRVAQNSHVNRMTSRNLAIVFSPTLMMKAPEPGEQQNATTLAMGRLLVEAPVLSTVVETLIDYASWVFGPIEFEEEEGAGEDEALEYADGEGSMSGATGISKEIPHRMSRVSVTSERDRFRAQRSSIGDDYLQGSITGTRPLSYERQHDTVPLKRDSVQWEGDEDTQRLRDALRRDRKNDNESLYRRKLKNRTQHLALDQWESLPEISSAANVQAAAGHPSPGERVVGLRWSWTPANNARDYGLSSSAEGAEIPFRPTRFSGAPEPRHREQRDRERDKDENEVVTNWRRSINSTHTTASTPSRKSVGSKRSNRPQSEVFIARPPSIAEGSHRSSLVISEA